MQKGVLSIAQNTCLSAETFAFAQKWKLEVGERI